MDDVRDLMYDMILESLTDYVESEELEIEEAEVLSEAAFDYLFTDDDMYDESANDDYYEEGLKDKYVQSLDKRQEKKFDRLDKRADKHYAKLRKKNAKDPEKYTLPYNQAERSARAFQRAEWEGDVEGARGKARKKMAIGDAATAAAVGAGITGAALLARKFKKTKELKAELEAMSTKELKAMYPDAPAKVQAMIDAILAERPSTGDKIKAKANELKDAAKTKANSVAGSAKAKAAELKSRFSKSSEE